MPCDIGYKSVSRGRVEAAPPLAYENRTAPPEVDADLLASLGVDDPVFADWIRELDTAPLLEQALERTLAAVGAPPDARLTIENGQLAARATAPDAARLDRTRRALDELARRWQLEVLGVVAELLDYDVSLARAGEALVLEGEKRGSGDVRPSFRITTDARGEVVVVFEHFDSDEELASEERRFRALAQKLGTRLVTGASLRSGQAIPAGAKHRHGKRGKQ